MDRTKAGFRCSKFPSDLGPTLVVPRECSPGMWERSGRSQTTEGFGVRGWGGGGVVEFVAFVEFVQAAARESC